MGLSSHQLPIWSQSNAGLLEVTRKCHLLLSKLQLCGLCGHSVCLEPVISFWLRFNANSTTSSSPSLWMFKGHFMYASFYFFYIIYQMYCHNLPVDGISPLNSQYFGASNLLILRRCHRWYRLTMSSELHLWGWDILKLPGVRGPLSLSLITGLTPTEIRCPSQGWWLSFIASALRRLGQGDCFGFEFNSSLDYKVRPVTFQQEKQVPRLVWKGMLLSCKRTRSIHSYRSIAGQTGN